MLGGVIFSSISSTNLIQRELQHKTILSILSRPVSIPQFYFGKLLGTFAILFLFNFVLGHVCWFSLVMGTPDTASTKLNYIPTLLLFIGMLSTVLLAILSNYTSNKHIISFIYVGWAVITPIIVLSTYIISPLAELPIPSQKHNLEFIKAATLIFILVLVISSFSISIGTFTSPLVNLVSCMVFLMIGLMAPGLVHHLESKGETWSLIGLTLPNFHSFWVAEMVSMGNQIPNSLILSALTYGLSLILAFSSFGTYCLMRRDFS